MSTTCYLYLQEGSSERVCIYRNAKKGLRRVYGIKTSAFQTAVPSRSQLPPPTSWEGPRLDDALESFISDVFILPSIYLTSSSISLTPHEPNPSLNSPNKLAVLSEQNQVNTTNVPTHSPSQPRLIVCGHLHDQI